MAFESLTDKLQNVFKNLRSKGRLTEADVKAALKEVKMALLEADVNFKVVKQFVKSVEERAIGSDVMNGLNPGQMVIKIVNEEMVNLMGSETTELTLQPGKATTVIMMCGLQGAGKTTHCAKLAKMYIKQGHRPVIAALDIYRPAAIEQLEIVAGQAGAPVFQLGKTDPAVIAKKAYNHARDYGNDILILDTAGRLHIDEQLMAELTEIKNTIDVTETLLVIDAMAGQDAVNVAKQFNETIGLDGVIVTKLDGDTRGGAALSVKAVTGKPIMFAGVGEKLDQLDEFHPDRMASRILGMGDVMSLIEKAESALDEKKAEELEKKLKQNKFDLNDLLSQFQEIKKMGPLKQVLGMIPGLGNQIKDADVDDKQLIRVESIIYSMTKKEREKPEIINASRKKRIAAGCGMKVEDVNRLLKQYEQMKKMFKQMNSKGGRRRRMPNLPGMNNMGGFGGF